MIPPSEKKLPDAKVVASDPGEVLGTGDVLAVSETYPAPLKSERVGVTSSPDPIVLFGDCLILRRKTIMIGSRV